MTQDKIKEAIAKAIYCHKGDLPAPWDNVGDGWEGNWSELRMEAQSQAAAVLEFLRPKRLAWQKSNHRTQFAIFTYLANGFVIEQRLNGTDFDLWVGPDATKAERFATLELAQSAAQAHADAAWLASLPLGDLVGKR